MSSLALPAQKALRNVVSPPGNETWTAQYYSGVNNYQLPTVIRLDIGYQFSFKTAPVDWKEIALPPILPNFSWRVTF